MPEGESFDAFYARTVGNITNQMHTLAGADSAADHAIREAYAHAYQQWYQVSSNPDPEGWVLAAAREAYQRRRPEAVPTLREPASAGPSSLSWPGLYRPAPGSPPWDPAAPVSESHLSPADHRAGDLPGSGDLPGGDSTIGAIPARAGITTAPGADHRQPPGRLPPPGQLGAPDLGRPDLGRPDLGRPGPAWPAPRQPGPRRPGSGGRLLPLIAAIAVILAGTALYLALTQRQVNSANHGPATQPSRSPTVLMLGLGKIGNLDQVPWTSIGPGWALAEVSSGPAASPQAGPITTYLVDPKGGAYQIQTAPAGPRPELLAWSGDHDYALYAEATASSASGTATATYRILSVRTGTMAALPLPPGTTAVGFSRPLGTNILAVHETATAFQLQRYDLLGKLQKTIGTLPRKPDAPRLLPGCTLQLCALSSPDGKTDVWGVAGDQMQVVGNATGAAVKKLATGTGSPSSCVPMTWWDTATVLSSCAVSGQPSASQLWLVPASGASPTALTGISGTPAGSGVFAGAWQAPGGEAYVTMTTFQQCAGAPSGPGGLEVLKLKAGESVQPVSIGGTTGFHNSIVSTDADHLLLLAQTGCPGPSSLIWLDPATGTTKTVLSAQAGQAGVLAAVPEGLGQPATSAG